MLRIIIMILVVLTPVIKLAEIITIVPILMPMVLMLVKSLVSCDSSIGKQLCNTTVLVMVVMDIWQLQIMLEITMVLVMVHRKISFFPTPHTVHFPLVLPIPIFIGLLYITPLVVLILIWFFSFYLIEIGCAQSQPQKPVSGENSTAFLPDQPNPLSFSFHFPL